MERILNSFSASPILSTFQAPFSAPLANIPNISSAERPNFFTWEEYSLILSTNSPEKSKFCCAPCPIKLNASFDEMPKFFIKASTDLILSVTSIPKVSLNAKALFVASSIDFPVLSKYFCTVATLLPTSSQLSP